MIFLMRNSHFDLYYLYSNTKLCIDNLGISMRDRRAGGFVVKDLSEEMKLLGPGGCGQQK